MVKKFQDITSVAKSEKRLSRRLMPPGAAPYDGNGHHQPVSPTNSAGSGGAVASSEAVIKANFAALCRELSETLVDGAEGAGGRPPRPVRSLSMREKVPSSSSSSSCCPSSLANYNGVSNGYRGTKEGVGGHNPHPHGHHHHNFNGHLPLRRTNHHRGSGAANAGDDVSESDHSDRDTSGLDESTYYTPTAVSPVSMSRSRHEDWADEGASKGLVSPTSEDKYLTPHGNYGDSYLVNDDDRRMLRRPNSGAGTPVEAGPPGKGCSYPSQRSVSLAATTGRCGATCSNNKELTTTGHCHSQRHSLPSSISSSTSSSCCSEFSSSSSCRKRLPPPEVPRRTSSISNRSTTNVAEHQHHHHQGCKNFHHRPCNAVLGDVKGSSDPLIQSPDGASLSSVQSSGSESSLTGSSSDRATPSGKSVDSVTLVDGLACSKGSAATMHEGGGGSPVIHDPYHAVLILEDKRLSNISENSEDSLEGMGYSSSPPVSEVMLAFQTSGILHTPCPTPGVIPCKVPEVVRKRQYRVGLNLFNKKPEKGIRYLIQRGFLENAPQAVARFLISRKGLSRQMIGEFLGNLQNPFNMETLECFANEIDLAGMQVDVALRKFQYHFRMPGEAQKIERIVEVYSHRYCDCNRDIVSKFQSMDTVFILAFAVIMLNTDLHTPNMKPERRMKVDDFIKNLRGIDEGADIERDMLVGIYERIKSTEFRPGSDHVTQVMKVQQTIVGKKPILALPHRRLVCYCRLYEVNDVNKKDRQGAHQREVFLFNDLLVVTKILSKKKNSVTYTFRQSYSLCGLQVLAFEVPHYPHGIRLAQKVDNKVLITFNARNEHDRSKFMEDLRESILEMDEMENLRIESELEKQKLARTRASENRDSGVADMELPPMKEGRDGKLTPDCGALKRSALSNSLLDIHEQTEKPQRRGSAGSLDSGMSISFQSSAASNGSRDSSPHQMLQNGKQGAANMKQQAQQQPGFLGGLFAKKGKSNSKTNFKNESTEV